MKDYMDKGLIKETVHPRYPELAIYNYTPACQYGRSWDDVTRAARGLIMNRETGEVIAKPWPKFFNLSEHTTIPDGPAQVREKMDGSLGIVFHYDDRWHIATRGSFTSDQAMVAQKWIENYEFPLGYTHLFEIIYPDNRIVVDYGEFSGLVYLESLSLETGRPHDLLNWWPRKAKSFGLRSPRDLPPHEDNAEGYVLYWPEHDFRVKVKFDEYVRLHKIMTGYSIKLLWEHISSGRSHRELIANVPDEFYAEVMHDNTLLLETHRTILSVASKIADHVRNMPSRKDQAAYIMVEGRDLSKIVFGLLDGKDVNDIVWRKVKEWLNF